MKIEVYTKNKVYNFTSISNNEYKAAVKRTYRKDGPSVIYYYKSRNIQFEYWYQKGKLNRKDGPAKIWYEDNGNIIQKTWLQNDKRHREDGPAEIWYGDNGNIESKYWFKNGLWDREDKPACINYYENGNIKDEYWYKNNKKNREDGPAVIRYDKNNKIKEEEFYLNGKKYPFELWIKKIKVQKVELDSKPELMKQMAQDRVQYNNQDYYISTTGDKPIVYTVKESKVFESFKESYNKILNESSNDDYLTKNHLIEVIAKEAIEVLGNSITKSEYIKWLDDYLYDAYNFTTKQLKNPKLIISQFKDLYIKFGGEFKK